MNRKYSRTSLRLPTLLCLAAGALLSAAGGCSTSSSADDDGRLEHHVPAHKPANYRAAVKQLQVRFQLLNSTTAADNSTANRSATGRTELLDILRWLPELAGDSDLRRGDWEQVQSKSQEMEQLIESSTNVADLSNEKQQRYQELLTELQAVVPRADRFEMPVHE